MVWSRRVSRRRRPPPLHQRLRWWGELRVPRIPNNTISAPVTQTINEDEILVVSVATGTFAGQPGCTDDEGNSYDVVVDKNTGSGRLFVCVSDRLDNSLAPDDNVTATYPSFSGVSVISVVTFDHTTNGVVDARNAASGSNPPVASGKICVTGGHWLFGVVANGNISNFTQDAPWIPLTKQSGGIGASKRTLSPVYRWVYGPCPEAQYELTGSLSGSGFWQAAIIGLQGNLN